MDNTNIKTVTIQAALFSLVSTAVAQIINAWKQAVRLNLISNETMADIDLFAHRTSHSHSCRS
jgi:hypothetical protein